MRRKFNEDALAVIRARHNNGETNEAISKDYGVHRTTIMLLLRRGIGKPDGPGRTWEQKIIRNGSTINISLSRQGEYRGDILVDAADEYLLEYKWRIDRHGYAVAYDNAIGRVAEIQCIINPPPTGLVNTHVNRNKLDNRRANLKHVTRSEAIRNSERCDIVRARPIKLVAITRTKGTGSISFHKGTQKYESRVLHNGKRIYLGLASTKDEAEEKILEFKQRNCRTSDIYISK